MPRVITGTARGMKLETLEGELTRPTADMVKEAVFSMIQFDVEGRRVLDLFAGSGQLGLEALSRGAAHAVFVDAAAAAAEVVKRNLKKAKLFEKSTVLNTDAFGYIRTHAGREAFDIIFLDPPYASGEAFPAAEKLVSAGMVSDYGMIVCETPDDAVTPVEGFTVRKHAKYGKTYITLLVRDTPEEEKA